MRAIRLFPALLAVGLAALTFAPAQAQTIPCAPAVTGFAVRSAICANGRPQISAAAPVGINVFARVFRNTTPDFNTATLIINGSLNELTFTDSSAASGVTYFYWFQWRGLNLVCPLGPVAGPVTGIRYSGPAAAPGASVAYTCTGVTVSWPRYFESSNFGTLSRTANGVTQIVATNIPADTTSFTDTTGEPGANYTYTFGWSQGICGGSASLPASPAIVFPPVTAFPVIRSADVVAGQTATLRVSSPTTAPAPSCQWFKNGQPVGNSGRIAGATTDTLTFSPALESDAGVYTMRITNPCGPMPDIQVALIVRKACPSDFDGNTVRNPSDIFAFLNSYFAGCP